MRLTLDDWPVSRVSWQVLTKIWWSWLLTVAVLEYVWHPRLKTRKWKVYIWRLDSFEPAICHLATYCSTVVSFLYLCTVSDYQYVSVSCSTLHLVPIWFFGMCLMHTDFFWEVTEWLVVGILYNMALTMLCLFDSHSAHILFDRWSQLHVS